MEVPVPPLREFVGSWFSSWVRLFEPADFPPDSPPPPVDRVALAEAVRVYQRSRSTSPFAVQLNSVPESAPPTNKNIRVPSRSRDGSQGLASPQSQRPPSSPSPSLRRVSRSVSPSAPLPPPVASPKVAPKLRLQAPTFETSQDVSIVPGVPTPLSATTSQVVSAIYPSLSLDGVARRDLQSVITDHVAASAPQLVSPPPLKHGPKSLSPYGLRAQRSVFFDVPTDLDFDDDAYLRVDKVVLSEDVFAVWDPTRPKILLIWRLGVEEICGDLLVRILCSKPFPSPTELGWPRSHHGIMDSGATWLDCGTIPFPADSFTHLTVPHDSILQSLTPSL